MGDPLIIPSWLRESLANETWNVAGTDCWICTHDPASSHPRYSWRAGGGHFDVDVRKLAWAVHHDGTPSRGFVYSTCGNRRCVAPDHLRVGWKFEAEALSKNPVLGWDLVPLADEPKPKPKKRAEPRPGNPDMGLLAWLLLRGLEAKPPAEQKEPVKPASVKKRAVAKPKKKTAPNPKRKPKAKPKPKAETPFDPPVKPRRSVAKKPIGDPSFKLEPIPKPVPKAKPAPRTKKCVHEGCEAEPAPAPNNHPQGMCKAHYENYLRIMNGRKTA